MQQRSLAALRFASVGIATRSDYGPIWDINRSVWARLSTVTVS